VHKRLANPTSLKATRIYATSLSWQNKTPMNCSKQTRQCALPLEDSHITLIYRGICAADQLVGCCHGSLASHE